MDENRLNKVILFDCMETLVDMYQIPGVEEYARWAYTGSMAEQIWDDFEQFLADFVNTRNIIKSTSPPYREYEIRDLYRTLLTLKLGAQEESELRKVSEDMFAKYWQAYVQECYVSDEVRNVLQYLLERNYTLGVVSNFIVRGGVEEILAKLGVIGFFGAVITSINVGWRKPHSLIYNEAVNRLNTTSNECYFIGDDYINDYVKPKELGFTTYLYDRRDRHKQIQDRFIRFEQLSEIIENYKT